ncbi:hypothetical protein [Plantibacter sp. VKM Ac-2880]|nr:hypothetical protein [Plantibacter sp. VKM Ac-2880]
MGVYSTRPLGWHVPGAVAPLHEQSATPSVSTLRSTSSAGTG